MLARSPATRRLPEPVVRYINRFVARRRLQRVLRAAARAALFTLAWALVWCVVDRLLALDSTARAALLVLNVAAVLTILARPVIALARRVDANAAAAQIERREPRLAQRLRTITSRLGDHHDDHGDGGKRYGTSPELLDALAQQVAAEVRDRDPAALVSWRPVVRPLAACALWLAVAWGLSFWSWLDLPTLARRYFLPARATPAVTTTRLTVTPGDADVTQGEPLRVRASASRLAPGGSLTLHVRPAGADGALAWHVEPMTAMPDGTFQAQIARVDRDLEYFLTGGDARSATYRVAMLPRPAVRRFRVRYAYPPHTGLAPRVVENETGAIAAPVGTEVTLTIEATHPISYVVMTTGAESTRVAPTATQPAAAATSAETSFTVTDDRRYTLRMVSDRGVSGVFRGGTIRAIADRAPVVHFSDADAMSAAIAARGVAAGDVVRVAYQAADDYGLARLDVDVRVIRRSGAEANVALPVPLAPGRREQQGAVPVELRRFGLQVEDEVELRLQAEDRAGQFALSAPVRFIVTADAPAPPAAPAAEPPADATTATTATTEPAPPEARESMPLDPPGYEEAIRAYFDALRRGAAPGTRP